MHGHPPLTVLEPPILLGTLRARGTPVHGAGHRAPVSWGTAVARGGSAGVQAGGRHRGAVEPGEATGERMDLPWAASEREWGCCPEPGLRDGNGAQAGCEAGQHPLSPHPAPCGTPSPHCRRDGGTRSPHPQHPRRSRTLTPAPTLCLGVPAPFPALLPQQVSSHVLEVQRCSGAREPGWLMGL